MFRRKFLLKIGVGLLGVPFVAAPQTNVLTANYNNQRTNANVIETILKPDRFKTSNFGKLGGFAVTGQIYAQPLYVGAVQIPGKGTKNAVFIATMNNNVYAIDADVPAATSSLWQVHLGDPVPAITFPDYTDIAPEVGILSTPVIDIMRQAIYVVAETLENGAPAFHLHALSLADGHEILNGPVAIAASVAGTGVGAVNGTVNFDAFWHLQRPGLALANNAIYIGFGAHGDQGPYHGWLIAYDAANLQHQVAAFSTTPDGGGGGIWQAGRAPAIDASGNLYVVSGNGDFDGHTNLSGCAIKLSGSDLTVLDWFAPADWQRLNLIDLDLGSTGGVLMPESNLLITGDKAGNLYHIDTRSMGHVEDSSAPVHFVASWTSIFQIGLWGGEQTPRVYQQDRYGPLKAYSVNGASVSETPVLQNSWNGDSLFQGMAISSDGESGGIVWETTGDRNRPGIPGTLHAFDASDLTQELWNSDMRPDDRLGAFAKFAVPLVVNGRVYVPTFSDQLVIYGFLTDIRETLDPQITALLNGASFIQDAISPGEVLAIMGANLGPGVREKMRLNHTGNVATELGGTEVFFDGIAAPITYTSSEQVGVVVPFGLAGTTVQVVAKYAGRQSLGVSARVARAVPALFSALGMGSGQGAILNADGSVNSPDNPAAGGSLIVLFATGLGQTSPQGQDGHVTAGTLLAPVLPPSVWIGGLPAEVQYAGSAPGIIEGVFQLNVLVPQTVPTGPAISVSLGVENAVSPNGITLAVR